MHAPFRRNLLKVATRGGMAEVENTAYEITSFGSWPPLNLIILLLSLRSHNDDEIGNRAPPRKTTQTFATEPEDIDRGHDTDTSRKHARQDRFSSMPVPGKTRTSTIRNSGSNVASLRQALRRQITLAYVPSDSRLQPSANPQGVLLDKRGHTFDHRR